MIVSTSWFVKRDSIHPYRKRVSIKGVWKPVLTQGVWELDSDQGGIRNEIQQVGINRMIQTSGIGNMVSVQFGSDKNQYLSGSEQPIDRRLRYILSYKFFSENVTFRIVGLTAFRGISLQVTYFFYIFKIYKYNKEYLYVSHCLRKIYRKIVFAYFFVTCNRIF